MYNLITPLDPIIGQEMSIFAYFQPISKLNYNFILVMFSLISEKTIFIPSFQN